MDNSIKLVDNKGKTVASCRKERFGPGNIVNICVKNGEDDLTQTFITLCIKYFRLDQED